MKYTASKDLVEIWFGSTEEPNLIQAHWPNGTAWASKAEAENWAKAFINSIENPESEFLAGNSPDEPLIKRSVLQEIADLVKKETEGAQTEEAATTVEE